MRQHMSATAFALAGLLCLAAVAPGAAAQSRRPARSPQAATQSDIQRLEDAVYDVGRSIERLRESDPELAGKLQSRLDGVRDEVTYLKVKFRKEGTVSQDEMADTRNRLEQLRAQAVGDIPIGGDTRPTGTTGTSGRGASESPDRTETVRQGRTTRQNEVPVGTELDVRLQTPLSSEKSQVEDAFQATTMVDLMNGDRMLVPAGSIVRGVVASVDNAGRLERKGSITLKFDQVTIEHRNYPLRATVTEALEGAGYRGDAAKIGAAAGVGAIIGGIIGGVKGALAGVLIGGGGVIAATEGQDVELPPGTVLRIRIDEPLVVR